jgi:hypothetical protein
VEQEREFVEKLIKDLMLFQRLWTPIFALRGKSTTLKKRIKEKLDTVPLEVMPMEILNNIQVGR